MLFQGGGSVALLEDVTGSEPQFRNFTWVSRTTNLLAYAGQNLQLVFQADGYSPLISPYWFADVDAVSFNCEHAADTPEFQVYLSRTATFRSTNLVGGAIDRAELCGGTAQPRHDLFLAGGRGAGRGYQLQQHRFFQNRPAGGTTIDSCRPHGHWPPALLPDPCQPLLHHRAGRWAPTTS